MNNKLYSRKAVLGAVFLGMSSLVLSGCGQKTSEEHIVAARQFVDARDTQSAIIEYKSAIQKNPKDPAPRFELGKIYLQQNNFTAAEKELNRALELGYKISEVLPLIARAYQETSSELALAEIDHKADGLTPVTQAEVTYYKLQALLRLEKYDEARVLLSEIEKIDTSSVYKGLSIAIGKVLDDNYEQALDEINALHTQAPLNQDVLLQQARLNMFLRQVDPAVDAYKSYLEISPEDTETKFILAAILMDAKRLDEAEPLVDDLLALNDAHALLNQFKGIIEVQKSDFSTGIQYLEAAIQNGRNDPLIRLLAGYSAYQLGDFEAATRHLSMIASELPPSHAALRMLADSLLQLGKNEEATDVLSRVDGESETDAMLFSKAGYQLLQSGNVVDAKSMIERSVPIATTAEDLARVGVLQLTINDADGLVNLEAAVERAPELSMGQQTLANAYIATRQFDKALGVADTWQKNEPQSASPWLVKAQVYIASEDYAAADAALAQAEKVDNQNLKVKVQRVSLAMLQSKPEEALVAVNEALAIDATDQASLGLLYLVQKQLGKADEGISYLQKTVSNHPANPVPKIVLARIYLGEREYDKGIALINAVNVEENLPGLFWETKGRLLLSAAKIDDAKAHYESWLKVEPQNKTAVMGMVILLDMQNRFKDGLDLTSSFLAKRPDRQVEMIKAYFHAMLREIPETEAILNKLTDEERSLPYVRAIQARLQLYKGDAAAAVPNAVAAYEAIGNTRNLVLAMAAYEMAGQPQESFELVKAFLQVNPDNSQAMLLHAERLINLDSSEAITAYRQIAQKQPENAIALNNLAYLEYQEGLLDEAEEHARQALKLAPAAPEIVDTLAQILIKKGSLDEAKEAYDTIISQKIYMDEVYLNYIELLLKMDQKTLAKRRLSDRVFESADSKARVAELQKQYNL